MGFVPEPCPVSDAFHQPLDRVLELLFYFIYYAAIGACEAAGCLISFKKVSADHKLSLSSELCKSPQYLAGYHNQWLG